MPDQLVSICVPVYNGEEFLEQCLASCLAQTYTHFEVIVCDDCSTDKSAQVVQKFMQQDQRIRFFRNEKNLGLVGNWNNAVKHANGPWIKMLFQDDYMSPDCLSRFIHASQMGIPLMVTRRNFVFEYQPGLSEEKDYKRKSARFDKWSGGKITHIQPSEIARSAAHNITINFIGEPSLTMFHKQEALDAGLFDKEFMQVCDLDFLLRISAEKGLVYIPEDLCFFRLHAQATTNLNASTHHFELRYLEPLLMASRLLAHRSYTALRQHLTAREKFRIRLYLNTRFLEARVAARKTGNTKVLEQYLAQHPSVVLIGKPRPAHYLVFAVLRVKRFFLRLGRKD